MIAAIPFHDGRPSFMKSSGREENKKPCIVWRRPWSDYRRRRRRRRFVSVHSPSAFPSIREILVDFPS